MAGGGESLGTGWEGGWGRGGRCLGFCVSLRDKEDREGNGYSAWATVGPCPLKQS